MTTKSQIVTVRGALSFAKLLGEPMLNYNKDGKEWKTDLKIGSDVVAELKSLGLKDKIKNKDGYLDGEPFLTFKHPAQRKNGEANDPVTVVDITGAPWDQNKLLGNGTIADIKFAVIDYGKGKPKGMYIRSVRVLKHAPYQREEFQAPQEDDEFYEEYKKMKEAQQDVITDNAPPVDNNDYADLDDDLN